MEIFHYCYSNILSPLTITGIIYLYRTKADRFLGTRLSISRPRPPLFPPSQWQRRIFCGNAASSRDHKWIGAISSKTSVRTGCTSVAVQCAMSSQVPSDAPFQGHFKKATNQNSLKPSNQNARTSHPPGSAGPSWPSATAASRTR